MRALPKDIFEGGARRHSSRAGIHRQIELDVKQAFLLAVALSIKTSAPKLRIGEVANWK
jgi:hypothetical protein